MSEIFHSIVDLVVSLVSELGYLGIFLLMTLESSFIPFPSEVVLIPAGYLVKQGEMSFLYVMLAGILGSLVGALINYYISSTFGRKFILKFGPYFFFTPEKFEKIEQAFLRHGYFATFVGRLIFGIRQWISIPAGLSKMPLLPFSILTSAGAGIWTLVLVALGYVVGKGEETEQMAKFIGYWVFGAIVLMIAAYFWWMPKKKTNS